MSFSMDVLCEHSVIALDAAWSGPTNLDLRHTCQTCQTCSSRLGGLL
jgi:hypothetical protein